MNTDGGESVPRTDAYGAPVTRTPGRPIGSLPGRVLRRISGRGHAGAPARAPARDLAELVGATPGTEFELSFDGRPIRALPGQSIAAALWTVGILSWRTTRVNENPRGAFCGIGSCFDCLATVNGRPNQRACLLPARPGDTITTQKGDGHGELLR